MIHKYKTVTIGIPAYNEGANIKHLIEVVLAQCERNFKLESVYVVNDGSTDDTATIVRSISNNKLHLIENSRRMGQVYAQNTIFAQAKSDIVIILEADTCPATDDYLALMVEPILHDSKVGLVQGNAIALPARTLVGRAIKAQNDIYYSVSRCHQASRDWIASGRGGRAFSASTYKKLHWPNAIPEDSYAMLWCRFRGIRTVFQELAVCNFHCSETFSDIKKEHNKVRSARKALEGYFDVGDIQKIHDRFFTLRVRMFLEFLIRYPVYILIFSALRAWILFTKKSDKFTDYWPTTTSTKKLNYE